MAINSNSSNFNHDLSKEYHKGYSIAEAMPVYGMGVTIGPETFAVAHTPQTLQRRIEILRQPISHSEIRADYRLHDTNFFSLKKARLWAKKDNARHAIIPFEYRCFDYRYVIYSSIMLPRLRWRTARHLINRDNLALVTTRAIKDETWSHLFVTRHIVPKEFISPQDNAFVFPLYLYNPENMLNFNPAFIKEVCLRLGLNFRPDRKSTADWLNETVLIAPDNSFTAESLFHYIYAVLHSPMYRQRYAPFLRLDFPRIPITSQVSLFWKLSEIGRELISLHLLEVSDWYENSPIYPVAGSNMIGPNYPQFVTPHAKPHQFHLPFGDTTTTVTNTSQTGQLYINETQYFEGVSDKIWQFRVGGYRPGYTWLNQRINRELDPWDDVPHYRQILVSLRETTRLMAEIDTAIDQWPMMA